MLKLEWPIVDTDQGRFFVSVERRSKTLFDAVIYGRISDGEKIYKFEIWETHWDIFLFRPMKLNSKIWCPLDAPRQAAKFYWCLKDYKKAAEIASHLDIF